MARTTGSNGPRTRDAIMSAGLELIYEHGYEAVTIRKLAAAVDLTQGAIYNHLESKQDLLYELVREHMTDLLAKLADAMSGLTEPRERLLKFIAFHIDYHATRRREVYIGNSELRSLTEPNKAEILTLRTQYENAFIGILQAAHEAGLIRVSNPKIIAYAIIAMLTGISAWYNPSQPLQLEALVRIHTDLALYGLGGTAELSSAEDPKSR